MRFLEESFVLGALDYGRAVEQFLGPAGDAEVRGVRWVEVVPARSGFRIVLHTTADVGSEKFCDLVEFPPLPPLDLDDEDGEFGREIAEVESPVDARAVAAARTGAVRGRWVNKGVAQNEYRDFVRAGRPDHRPSDTA